MPAHVVYCFLFSFYFILLPTQYTSSLLCREMYREIYRCSKEQERELESEDDEEARKLGRKSNDRRGGSKAHPGEDPESSGEIHSNARKTVSYITLISNGFWETM